MAPIFQKKVAFKLTQKRLEAFAKKNFAEDMNAPSEMRMVSLVRLEEACREFAEEKKHVTPEIQYLAGLQRSSLDRPKDLHPTQPTGLWG